MQSEGDFDFTGLLRYACIIFIQTSTELKRKSNFKLLLLSYV